MWKLENLHSAVGKNKVQVIKVIYGTRTNVENIYIFKGLQLFCSSSFFSLSDFYMLHFSWLWGPRSACHLLLLLLLSPVPFAVLYSSSAPLLSSYVYQSQDIALSIFPVFFQPYMSSLTPSLSLTLRTSKARVSAKSQLDTNVVDLGRLLTTPKKEN